MEEFDIRITLLEPISHLKSFSFYGFSESQGALRSMCQNSPQESNRPPQIPHRVLETAFISGEELASNCLNDGHMAWAKIALLGHKLQDFSRETSRTVRETAIYTDIHTILHH